jgi:hypothetical protein
LSLIALPTCPAEEEPITHKRQTSSDNQSRHLLKAFDHGHQRSGETSLHQMIA